MHAQINFFDALLTFKKRVRMITITGPSETRNFPSDKRSPFAICKCVKSHSLSIFFFFVHRFEIASCCRPKPAKEDFRKQIEQKISSLECSKISLRIPQPSRPRIIIMACNSWKIFYVCGYSAICPLSFTHCPRVNCGILSHWPTSQ